jgi:hypothetical protein
MFPRFTTNHIDVEIGIQLNMADRQFPGSLCAHMIEFQAPVDDPMNYFLKNVLPKFAKKHLGTMKKFKPIYEYEKKTPRKACPIFITNYLEEFILTLSPVVKYGDTFTLQISSLIISFSLQLIAALIT